MTNLEKKIAPIRTIWHTFQLQIKLKRLSSKSKLRNSKSLLNFKQSLIYYQSKTKGNPKSYSLETLTFSTNLHMSLYINKNILDKKHKIKC